METISYITGLLTFYMKGEISKDENFIYLKRPNSIFGLIPLGKTNKQMMVNQIASTSSGFKVIVRDFIIGLLEAIFGFSALGKSFLIALLLILIGGATIISSLQTTLTVNLTSGEQIDIFFIIFEKEKAEQAVRMINEAINLRMNETNNRKVAEWQTDQYRDISNTQTDRIIDALNENKRK